MRRLHGDIHTPATPEPVHLHCQLEPAPDAEVVGGSWDVGEDPAGSDIEVFNMICSWIRQEVGF